MTHRLTRRNFLRGAAGLALAASLPTPTRVYGSVFERFLGPSAKLTTAITPNDEFYITSYRSPPTVDVGTWELAIKGLVERPFTLTYPRLLARPSVTEIVTLECVGNGVGGDAIGTADWEGVSLKTLLDEAGASAKAYDVVFRAADGYSDSIRLERAMAGDVLVATKMNGVPLPRGHGFPARIIVPGIYGMKHVQWLTEIEVVEGNYTGYYQKQGWSDDATVKTMSRIDFPRHGDTLEGPAYTVRGLAFAGTRGIRQVEMSTDGGQRWALASLADPLSSYAWRFWSYRWTIPALGRYTLMVRATDGTGLVQSSEEQEPFPGGTTGLHQVTVSIEG
jgi:DMSO/TMAO reductase YedYZ molybdopterin-dependent catalytic subunit